jgi:hypothetical protein
MVEKITAGELLENSDAGQATVRQPKLFRSLEKAKG